MINIDIHPGVILEPRGPGRKDYVANVAHDVRSVDVIVKTDVPDAQVRINGSPIASIAVDVGRTVIDIAVTAPSLPEPLRCELKVFRDHPTPTWRQVAKEQPWKPRDSAGELVYGDRMWLFGGYTPQVTNDVWRSADGVQWDEVGAIPCGSGVNIPLRFVFDDAMWLSATSGRFYRSCDGVTWELVAESQPWGRRLASGSAVFNGRMWVMGGRSDGRWHNDVWSSSDGINWTLELEAAPWSPRQLHDNLIVHDNKLWIVGGAIQAYHPFRTYRDVWCSPNGRDWALVTDEAPWPGRSWFSCASYHDHLWMFGGFRSEPVWKNRCDVWYSRDGATWHELKTPAVWSPRHEVSPYVFDGKLWVVGGNAWPLENDVWHLQLNGLAFVTQPVIEEFIGTQYRYTACAAFNRSGGRVRYRLIEGPPWLSVDETTGVLTGRTEDGDDAAVTLLAFDDAGETAEQTFSIHLVR